MIGELQFGLECGILRSNNKRKGRRITSFMIRMGEENPIVNWRVSRRLARHI